MVLKCPEKRFAVAESEVLYWTDPHHFLARQTGTVEANWRWRSMRACHGLRRVPYPIPGKPFPPTKTDVIDWDTVWQTCWYTFFLSLFNRFAVESRIHSVKSIRLIYRFTMIYYDLLLKTGKETEQIHSAQTGRLGGLERLGFSARHEFLGSNHCETAPFPNAFEFFFPTNIRAFDFG